MCITLHDLTLGLSCTCLLASQHCKSCGFLSRSFKIHISLWKCIFATFNFLGRFCHLNGDFLSKSATKILWMTYSPISKCILTVADQSIFNSLPYISVNCVRMAKACLRYLGELYKLEIFNKVTCHWKSNTLFVPNISVIQLINNFVVAFVYQSPT